MILKSLPVVFFLFAGLAHAQVAWGPTGRDAGTSVSGVGDPMSPEGANLRLAATSVGHEGFAGAMAALDATGLRGREVELTGLLWVTEGSGPAALWLRADGPAGSLAFRNSAKSPFQAADGPQVTAVRLYVPSAATSIKLGTTLRGIGALEASSITLRVLEDSSSGTSAYEVLEAAITAMQANALRADQVDWASESARRLAPELRSRPAPEAYAQINELLKALGDRHSYLRPQTTSPTKGAGAGPLLPISSSVSTGVGHLLVPGWRGTDLAAGQQFSSRLCEALSAGEQTASQGWIVDLRQNPGGNMWPMITGLRPLLGEGHIGSFKDRDGKVRPWQAPTITGCASQQFTAPVAVLIGPGTASSGEAVAVAFRGRANTRFFGQPTAGVATSNRGFPLPDGSALMLTTAAFLDRNGTVYPEGIDPDVRMDEEDPAAAAEAWLRSHGG